MAKNMVISQIQEIQSKVSEAIELQNYELAKSLSHQNENLLLKLDSQLSQKQDSLEKLINSILKSISTNKSLNDKLKLELSNSISSDVIKLLLENQN